MVRPIGTADGHLAGRPPPTDPPGPALLIRTSLGVAAGGALGGLARGVAVAVAGALGWPVWPVVLAINVAGSAAIGVAARGISRAWLTAGVLGGFTTFSGWVLDVAVLLPEHPVAAVALAVATPVLCVAATAAALPRAAR